MGKEPNESQREAIRKLHCMVCYDVVRSKPKHNPCECRCHDRRARTTKEQP